MIYLHIAIKFNLVKNKNKKITLSSKFLVLFKTLLLKQDYYSLKMAITTQTF